MAKENKNAKSGISFIWGVATGVIVGGVSALLFAPKKGSELREDIKEGTSKVVEASTQTLQAVSSKAVEVGKAVEAKAVKLVNGAKQTVQSFSNKEEVQDVANASEQVLEDVKTSGTDQLLEQSEVLEDVQAVENVQ